MRSTPRSVDSDTHLGERESSSRPFEESLPWLLVVFGSAGLVAAFTLTIEKFTLATDPDYLPSCSINPVLNCGSVMSTAQAQVFGFPNSLLGIVGFSAVAVIGAAALAGAEFARWFWVGLQVGVTAAAVFVHWLIVQSLYEIGALCPYCMIVWAVTVPVFWYVTLRTLDLCVVRPRARRAVDALLGVHSVPLTLWFLVLVAMVGHRFWSYWSTLL
jgi:uncharacterized membrane protein